MTLQYDDAFRVVSGSYDKSAKVVMSDWYEVQSKILMQVWDLRKPSKHLVSFNVHEGAVFCLKVRS
jgi:hypothetical protein